MFKVICIVENPMFAKPHADWLIKFGEIYTVTYVEHRHGSVYYELHIQPNVGYTFENFALISDISETDFIREYNKEKV